MTTRSTCEVRTPVYNPRTLKLFLHHDPLGIGRMEPYNFDLEVFDTYDESSYFRVVMEGGRVLTHGPATNDFYGPGSSVVDPVEDAEKWVTDFGANLDQTNVKVQVIMEIEDLLVFRSSEKPFYSGSLKMYLVPSNWWRLGTTSYDEQPRPTTRKSVVWENGKWTDEAKEIEDLLVARHASDALGAERTGRLREVKRFTQGE